MTLTRLRLSVRRTAAQAATQCGLSQALFGYAAMSSAIDLRMIVGKP
jgi:hypothetical protein